MSELFLRGTFLKKLRQLVFNLSRAPLNREAQVLVAEVGLCLRPLTLSIGVLQARLRLPQSALRQD